MSSMRDSSRSGLLAAAEWCAAYRGAALVLGFFTAGVTSALVGMGMAVRAAHGEGQTLFGWARRLQYGRFYGVALVLGLVGFATIALLAIGGMHEMGIASAFFVFLAALVLVAALAEATYLYYGDADPFEPFANLASQEASGEGKGLSAALARVTRNSPYGIRIAATGLWAGVVVNAALLAVFVTAVVGSLLILAVLIWLWQSDVGRGTRRAEAQVPSLRKDGIRWDPLTQRFIDSSGREILVAEGHLPPQPGESPEDSFVYDRSIDRVVRVRR